VTLSGCDTAVGEEVAGEGLIGLTRVFQYAGARSVLASMWRFEDEVTAVLMGLFYSGLEAGLSKDEALRLAQLQLVNAPTTPPTVDQGPGGVAGRWLRSLLGQDTAQRIDASHPFFWAAFRLEGDWL